jgi:hypothetical protein
MKRNETKAEAAAATEKQSHETWDLQAGEE